MKRLFAFLSTAAICAVVSAAPAAAQVAGNPGDLTTAAAQVNAGQGYYYRLVPVKGRSPRKAPKILMVIPPGYAGATAYEESLPAAHCFLQHWVNNGASHPMYVTMCGPE
jgi:hypothetical protein